MLSLFSLYFEIRMGLYSIYDNDYINFVYCGNYKTTELSHVSEKRTLSYKNLIFWNMR